MNETKESNNREKVGLFLSTFYSLLYTLRKEEVTSYGRSK